MKKILLAFVLILGIVFIGSATIGAKMNKEISQVSAKHILVDTKEEAIDIKSKIDSNTITFEDAAKQFSKCPSGQKGGDLGYFGRGMMVKPFEDASFEADVNKVTDPIQTQFGWHLIKVVDKK